MNNPNSVKSYFSGFPLSRKDKCSISSYLPLYWALRRLDSDELAFASTNREDCDKEWSVVFDVAALVV